MPKYKIIKTETSGKHSLTTEEVFNVKEHAIAWYNKEGIRAVAEGLRAKKERPDGITLSDGQNTIDLTLKELP